MATIFATIDPSGRPTGFYSTDVWDASKIPAGAVEIDPVSWKASIAFGNVFFVAGKWVTLTPAATDEQVQARFVAVTQRHLDTSAKTRFYDSIFTAVTYAEEAAVLSYQAEGKAFRSWRSLVWAKCYQTISEIKAGTRAVPTDQDFVALLPALVLP